MKFILTGLALLAFTPAMAGEAAPSPRSPAVVAPAGASVTIEVTEALNSSTAKIGQTFALRLAQPLVVNGTEVLPSGLTGVGEVIDAKPGRSGGYPGRLILAAKYLEDGDRRVLLKAFSLSGSGESNSGKAFAVGAAAGLISPLGGLASFAVQGGNMDVPAGARGDAKLSQDTAAKLAPPTPSTLPTTQETP